MGVGLDQLLTVVLGLDIWRVGQPTSSPLSSPPVPEDELSIIALASLLLAAMSKDWDQFPCFHALRISSPTLTHSGLLSCPHGV